MVGDRKRLAMLSRITELRVQRDQAKLAEILAEEADLRRKLQDLDAQQRASTERQRQHDDPAFKAGADAQWHVWVEQHKSALNTQLGRVLAQKIDFHAVLQRSFGQNQAANQLERQSLKELAAVRHRRDAYES